MTGAPTTIPAMTRLLLVLLLTTFLTAQSAPEVDITAEPHHHLVLANDQVRVFNVDVPPHVRDSPAPARTRLHLRHARPRGDRQRHRRAKIPSPSNSQDGPGRILLRHLRPRRPQSPRSPSATSPSNFCRTTNSATPPPNGTKTAASKSSTAAPKKSSS